MVAVFPSKISPPTVLTNLVTIVSMLEQARHGSQHGGGQLGAVAHATFRFLALHVYISTKQFSSLFQSERIIHT